MITIEMRKVTLGYGTRKVVTEIDLEVVSGEMVGLIGPNGCGKSTIIRALSHVISPQGGKVLVNGREIGQISRREMARVVSVVPQIPLLPSIFTAFEIVLMGRYPYMGVFQHEGREELEVAYDALAKTGIAHLAKRRVGELSGGEIQSVLIARALAQQTSAIILDEPTANLDIGRQLEILDIIKRLCRENSIAVLVALHDLNLAAQYADRLYLVNHGAIHAEGTPREVITQRNIGEVYGARHCVYPHPANGLPAVLLDSGNNNLGK